MSHVTTSETVRPASPAAPGIKTLHIEGPACVVCGRNLAGIRRPFNCPGCGTPARVRAFVPIVEQVLKPALDMAASARHALAIAATSHELAQLEKLYPKITNGARYGKHLRDAIDGLDVRDLSRFPAASFDSVFSIGAFIHFVEHETAFRQANRVLKPGAFLLVSIGGIGLLEGEEPAEVEILITGRPGSHEYLPPGVALPKIQVGRMAVVNAMRRAGFEAECLRVYEEENALCHYWFVGRKMAEAGPGKSDAREARIDPATLSPDERRRELARQRIAELRDPAKLIAAIAEKSAELGFRASTNPPLKKSGKHTPELVFEYQRPLDAGSEYKSVRVRVTVPSVPWEGRRAVFAEHVFDRRADVSTDRVIGCETGAILVSDDLGATWTRVEVPGASDIRFHHVFTKDDGGLLLQGLGRASGPAEQQPADPAPLFILDRDLKLVGRARAGEAHWHGSRSVDEHNGTIMFAEYYYNGGNKSYAQKPGSPGHDALRANSIFRSRDGGHTWQPVLTVNHTEVRHFHTIVADPVAERTWWASSGDLPSECRVWRSSDDGDTWRQVTHAGIKLDVHPSFRGDEQAAFRYTDVVVTRDHLIWGADDFLGGDDFVESYVPVDRRVGSRVFMAAKSDNLTPVDLGYCGSHIRSIVDIGPGYMLMTEAKFALVGLDPQVFYLPKGEGKRVQHLFDIPNLRNTSTGFTESRASKMARNGVFFSSASAGCPSIEPVRILKWDVDFS